MFTVNNNIKTARANSLKKCLLLFTVSLLALTQVVASELNAEHYSISQGQLKKNWNEQQRQTIIAVNKQTQVPDQLNGNATAKTRISIVNSATQGAKKSKNSALTQSQSNVNYSQSYDADFAIYGATSVLEDDDDGDGFYQTFSVTFDADVYSYTDNQLAEVYALLYISKNGGPWTHYFTTDNFIIEGDTDLDEYQVITTFLSGYSSDYYDVLIDLYQVGYSDIVATYSSDDSNALYALPLESADYDEPYVEVVDVSNGGSFSLASLLIILLSTAFRSHK